MDRTVCQEASPGEAKESVGACHAAAQYSKPELLIAFQVILPVVFSYYISSYHTGRLPPWNGLAPWQPNQLPCAPGSPLISEATRTTRARSGRA